MDFLKKICLGTVQFGYDYGIANKTGQVSQSAAFEILEYARKIGIKTLDTSSCYGASEEVLGNFWSEKKCPFDIVSKFSWADGSAKTALRDSLKKLKLGRLYGYLIHHFDDFRKDPGRWRSLAQLKKEGHVKKIGFSLYLPAELKMILQKKIIPDLIQVPYSIFDRRFEPYFGSLRSLGVEIHTRSSFLQGLVYLSPYKLTNGLAKAREHIRRLRSLSYAEKIPVSGLCLNYVLLNPAVDRIVVGVDSLKHLKDNAGQLKFFRQVLALRSKLDRLAIEDEDILLPYRWRPHRASAGTQ